MIWCNFSCREMNILKILFFFRYFVLIQTYPPWQMKDLVWKNVMFFVYLHIGSFYGIYQIFTGQCTIATILMSKFNILNNLIHSLLFERKVSICVCCNFQFAAILLVHWGLLGITAGAHRLWSHKAYKAKWPLKLILTFFNTIAHQNGIWVWVLDHR